MGSEMCIRDRASRSPIIDNTVWLFPEPDSPTMPSTSSPLKLKLRSLTAWIVSPLLLKLTLRFLVVSRSGGVSTIKIIMKHIVPNLLGVVVVYVAHASFNSELVFFICFV